MKATPKPTSQLDSNSLALPYPTQAGLTKACTSFHRVEGGETCYSIVQKYGTFTLADFYDWNPAVGSECRRLFAEFYVCVGAFRTQSSKSLSKNKVPSPTQAGIVKTCNKYHEATLGEGCWLIATIHGIELDKL